MRWFFRGDVPLEVQAWFHAGQGQPAEPQVRVDHYLRIAEGDTLGIKLRDGRIEVKQRQHQFGAVALHERVTGIAEQWRKWSFALADRTDYFSSVAVPALGWVGVHKRRWLSRYRITDSRELLAMSLTRYPDEGCDLELTSVGISGCEWWTLGFEAFGTEASLQEHLSLAAEQLLEATKPPSLPTQNSFGYPRWLQILAQRKEV